MWRVFSGLVVVCLLCLFPARAQTVNETESRAAVGEKTLDVTLVVESLHDDYAEKITLELLDAESRVRAQTVRDLTVKKGKDAYRLALSLGDWTATVDDDLVWQRLRYRVGDSTGIVSLSELIEDDFELRVAASENFTAGTNYRVRVRAFQPYTNQPIAGVRVAGELQLELDSETGEDELALAATGATDADGFALLDFAISENLKLDGDGDLKITGARNGIVRTIDEDLDERETRAAVFLTADKPIYQPGQTFNVRGLYFDENQRARANAALEFKIYDEDGTTLYRENATTSEFGVAAISWKLPDNAKLGNYRVAVEADDDLQKSAMSFRVTRYDLPNFSVTAKPNKTFYLPNEPAAEITVRADYLFGKPVARGRVRVVQEAERRWNYKAQKYDAEEKQTFEGELNADGAFVVRADLRPAFKSLLEENWRRFEDLHFAAYFTDLTTNKTEQKRFDVRLSKEAIHVYLGGRTVDQNPKLPVTLYVSTFYADGAPAECDVEITGKYEDAEKTNRFARIKTNRFGAGKFKFSAVSAGEADWDDDYEIKIRARDFQGQTGTFDEEIDFSDENALRIETDKTIFKPGETVKISVASTAEDALVYLDIVREWTTIDSYFVKLRDGKADLKVPYNPKFKGNLTLVAYTDENDGGYYDSQMKAARGVIFPAQDNLKLEANFAAATYKPSEEARVNFSVADGENKAVQSALGVVVFDQAVEQRARTDADFGGYFNGFYGLLGYQKSFGAVTLKSLNDLDLSKPVAGELQLAAEIMLANDYFYPRIYRTRANPLAAKSVYAEYFKRQFAPIEAALKNQFERNGAHPVDDASLRAILSANGVDFDRLLDPWNQPYRAVFSTDRTQNIVTLTTAGANEIFGTADDFPVSTQSFTYFTSIGKRIDEAVKNYHRRTGAYIRDYETLRRELARQNFDLNALKDRWNRDYRITFEVSRRNYTVTFHSFGANASKESSGDDFTLWSSQIDYFAETEVEINEILSRAVNRDRQPFPQSETEFRKLLQANGTNVENLRDGYGNSVYLAFVTQFRYADKTKIENGRQTVTPVTQEVAVFKIRSRGANQTDAADDFDLAEFSSVVTEQSKDTLFSKADVRNIATTGARGAIRGVVLDPSGAVIPNAQVTATDETNAAKIFTATSNEAGEFLLGNLPSGKYTIKIDSASFKSLVYTNIQVRSQNLVEINATLEVGAVAETVEITSGISEVTTVTSSQIKSLPINGRNFSNLLTLKPGAAKKEKSGAASPAEENSTPRLREYFPETLVWSPEIITDKNGRAEMKFKLADNITTWKLYTIASTKTGKIGVAEREFQTFQPFFVDLDPPKFLTAGDEIHLPTQIRNYTDKKQKVAVAMAAGDWFSLLNPANQTVEIAANNSENAVFGFKVLSAVKNGKQRVTALAAKDSDAIEKPVTVRPNGQEIVTTDSKLFQKAARFDVNFPAHALPETAQAELKIYPNLMAHVTESVEGLLQRPTGCGEQTISSTYPNLMILKFTKEDSRLRQTARKYLQKGYERLIGYQTADGGFSYWGGKDAADVALTAYAIRFLSDARPFVAVDETALKRAKDWLVKQQRADGSFTKKYYYETSEDTARTRLFTAYVARTLAMLGEKDSAPLQKAFSYLKIKNAAIDEPYALALYALAALDTGNGRDAEAIIETLAKTAIPENDGVYWKLETNTPFYGWGTAGRVETTALVVQTLLKGKRLKTPGENAKLDELIAKGTIFLLKNKDRYGVWYSTQTTVNVLDAFLAALAENSKTENQTLQIFLNGANIQSIQISADKIEPIVLKLNDKISGANNIIEVKSSSGAPVMAQTVAAHYVDWKNARFLNQTANESRALRLDYQCDKQNARIMEEVNCRVAAERIGFQSYGMLLAEIGIPPGADVSRESLQEAMKNDWSLSRYDVLPDRIILYMWSKAGGTKFNFKFKPRYGINANTPASIVYDYYNEEARATVAPLRFNVK